jgi:ArsR family transcriptional regulator, lead/cadmium/zinc/bismuth-responsive transcriptional repressor
VSTVKNLPSCPSKPSLTKRQLLAEKRATELERVFETLASATRLRILHALVKGGEVSPNGLAEELAMKPQAVSNQLQRLSDRGIVQARREGNNVLYGIVDRCVIDLIDRGLCLLEDMPTSQATRRP